MAGKKLLVADDSLTIQKVIRLALSNEGYEIQTVSDGDDAVQQISLFRPDIVLIDVSLPGQSAFDVKRAVNTHEDLQGVRFVLMSSAFEKIDEKQLATLIFDGRLTKPFDPAHLRQVLSGVLSRAPSGNQTAPIPTAPIPTALVTPPPPQAPLTPLPIPPRPISQAGAPTMAPAAAAPGLPPIAPAQSQPAPPPPQFSPPQAPPPTFTAPPPQDFPDFSPDPIEDGPAAPPPGLIAEEDNYGPKYIPTPPSSQEEVTQPFLNPFQSPRQPGNAPITTKTDSLWDDHDSRFDVPPPPPPSAAPLPPPPAPTFAPLPPLPAAPKAEGGGDDIRHLTESTIRMSGLDDFEWTVNEPSLKPPPAFGDSPDFPMDEPPQRAPARPSSSENIEEEEATEFIMAPSAAHLPPITTGSFTPPPPPGKSPARGARPAPAANSAPAPSQAQAPTQARAQPPVQQHPAQMAAPSAPPMLDSAELERIVRKQVQETLEKLAQKILPEVAEKVIKQEIHRMLSELP